MEKEKPKEFKILLLGESDVGKTSIFKRYLFNNYEEKMMSTIGVELETKILNYNNKNYSITLIDTTGQERFKSITKSYYHMGDGFFIVFDLTNEDSLNAIEEWIDSIRENKENPKIIILGNKDDLKKNRISEEIINNQLEKYKNMIFIKTSAKTNHNIKEAIKKMIDLLENNINIGKLHEENKEKKDTIQFIFLFIFITKEIFLLNINFI